MDHLFDLDLVIDLVLPPHLLLLLQLGNGDLMVLF